MGVLGDFEGYKQLLPGIYKSNKTFNITGIDKIHLKCDCVIGSFVNSIREPILYSLALDKPPGQKIISEPRMTLFRNLFFLTSVLV